MRRFQRRGIGRRFRVVRDREEFRQSLTGYRIITIGELGTKKIDEMVLALVNLTLNDGSEESRPFDWDAMDRLHEPDILEDAASKVTSVGPTG